MTINEFLNYSPKQILTEGITHVEDLVIDRGGAGAKTAVQQLTDLAQNKESISLKWDGFPAVVFGRDETGQLVFMDKHMYDKVAKGKMPFMSIAEYDAQRGVNRGDLWKKEQILVRLLDKIVPAVKNQFWMGDLMWAGKLSPNGDTYAFRPNTVEYHVNKSSDLGKRIAKSQGGIAVHTFIPGLGQSDQPLTGLQGLNENGGIVFLQGEMSKKPTISVNPKDLAQLKKIVDQNAPAVDKFVADLTAMKGKSVITSMSPFITSMLEANDIHTDIVPRFLEFLGGRLTENAKKQLLADGNGWLYQAGAAGLRAMWTIWLALTNFKLMVKKQIDDQLKNSDVVAITDGVSAHEGYVVGGGSDKIKLVDRLEFSKANFAKHRVPAEEIAAKQKMPLAAFCFGRMNPPTVGHELVMKKTVQTGAANSFIFLSNSHGAPDNPLDPKTKADFIKKIYPQYAKHIVDEAVTGPIQAANWLYAKGFRNIAFIGGSDRLGNSAGSIEKLLNGWNRGDIRNTDYAFGPEGREHVNLSFVSSGERDADASSVTGISGSLARKYAAANDQANFQRATGVADNIKVNGKTLFQATQQGMNIAPAAAEKPADAKDVVAKAAKKQAKKAIAESAYADDIQFHKTLNPVLWDEFEMLPEVATHLKQIASAFYRFLDLPSLKIMDITVSGSNAAFTYTDQSDIDLHLIARVDESRQEFIRKYVDAKKTIFNDQHNITIGDHPVEVYVQFSDQPHVSAGVYSVAKDRWIEKPRAERAQIDHMDVQSKLKYYIRKIRMVIKQKDLAAANELMSKLRAYRKQGLAESGEFGTANLVFKLLRNQGFIDRLAQFRIRQQDWELSLEEESL